jgi:hypothetical protein
MLLDARRRVLQAKNPSAAVAASGRIVDLMLGKFAEKAAAATNITTNIAQLTHVIVYQVVCPVCKERSAVSATPPPEAESRPSRPRAAGMTGPSPHRHLRWSRLLQCRFASRELLRIPRLPKTGRRRDNPIIRGLAWAEL